MADVPGTYQLGPGHGRVLVRTGRAGLAARAGHDLTMEITRWSGQATIPEAGVEAAAITADLDFGSLAVREGTGGARPLTDRDRGDIENTARKILGGGDQAVARFTSSRIIPSAAGSSSAGGAIEGTVTFRGRTQPLRLQVTSPAPGRYRAAATIRQSDFGITPYTGFFGALKLKDEVTLDLEADLTSASA